MIIRTLCHVVSITKGHSYTFGRFKSKKNSEGRRARQNEIELNRNANLRQAMLGGWQMVKGQVPFSYDGYQWICNKAIEYQPELSKDDIFMLMQLGVEHKVKLEPFGQHIQNQLFLRIHRDFELDMMDYDEQVSKELKDVMSSLQVKSMDYFQMLKEQDEDEQGQIDLKEEMKQISNKINNPLHRDSHLKQQQIPEEKELNDLNKKYFQNRAKQFQVSDLIKISQLLIQWNSTNTQLLKYLQQLLTIKLQPTKVDSSTALSYLKFLTFVCQTLFKEYKDNTNKYTPRSIKRIYKYQYFYFQEHFRQLIKADSDVTVEFLEGVVEQYAAFPIKRRELRRKIGIYMGSQIRRFNLTGRDDLIKILMDLSGKDQKMKKTYRGLFGLPEPEQPMKLEEQDLSLDSPIVLQQEK